ncbi:MAG: glycosyltransferase family 2 protein [Parvularculaceae bacterium]
MSADHPGRHTKSADPDISLVCPFYNEEILIGAAIERLIPRMAADFAGSDYEIIFVNDGSTDRSQECAEEALRRHPSAPLRILGYPFNQGRGRALKTGIDAARGRIIVTTEADLSWGEDIVLRLTTALRENPHAHFVVASVHARGGGLRNVPILRRVLTTAGNTFIRMMFTGVVTMHTGMTRAYWREVIQPLVTVENGKEFHLEVILKLLALGFRPMEIPATIAWPDAKAAPRRARRKSSTNLTRTIGTHLRFAAIARPVQYFSWLAVAALLLGAASIAVALVSLFLEIPSSNFAIVGLILVLFGFALGAFSVVFHQLGEHLSAHWRSSYPPPHPPSATPARVLYENGRETVRG